MRRQITEYDLAFKTRISRLLGIEADTFNEVRVQLFERISDRTVRNALGVIG